MYSVYHNVGRYWIFAVLLSNELLMQVTSTVVDLGHSYHNHASVCWDPAKRFEIFDVQTGTGPNGEFTLASFSTPEHCGTHLDAPFHFNPAGWKLENIPLERLVVEGVHVNVSDEVNGKSNFLLTADHLKSWVRVNGPLASRTVILVNFGWAHKFGDRRLYFNNGLEDKSKYAFPALSEDAAQWIVDSGKVYGVGVDGPSVDPGDSVSFGAHGILSKANLYNLENVALNGTTLPSRGFKLVVQPIKIVGGTGGPVRILAFTNNAFE